MTNEPLLRSKSGFSLLEVLLAITILMTALVFLYGMFSSANRGTLDSYRETIAYSMAFEGLEWVAGIGYQGLVEMQNKPNSILKQKLGIGQFKMVKDLRNDAGKKLDYPIDYNAFERQVSLTHHLAKRSMVVTVTVRPVGSAFIRRGSVVLEKIVGAEYD